jgi:hypothetical protein
MVLSTIVDKDTTGLEMVLNAIGELEETRFIEGVKTRRYTSYDVKQMTEMLGLYQHRVNIEANALSKFSETFIGSYATPNNKCFSQAAPLFKSIRSTLTALRNVFRKTSPISRRQLPVGMEAPTVFERSALNSNNEYTPDMFGLESYPDEVRCLYNVLETLLSSATSVLALCNRMMLQEEETRNDPVQLRQIYDDSCKALLETARAAKEFIDVSRELPYNEMEEQRKKAGSDDDEKFLRDNYHQFSKKDMAQYVILKVIRNAHNDGLTEIEGFYWKNNSQKALRARYIAENFNRLPNAEGQKGSVNSRTIVTFLKWCGVRENLEKKLYERYIAPKISASGKLKPLGWNTISGVRKELKDLGSTDESLAKEFDYELTVAKM